MDRKIKSYLFDILTCTEEIEEFFEGSEITLETLLTNRKTLRAEERDLEIIGEATKRLLKSSPEISISYAKEIIGARNFIAHEYGSISYEIIKNHLPVLKNEVKALLKD
jgi:uncharacterized protein with HEPN domain